MLDEELSYPLNKHAKLSVWRSILDQANMTVILQLDELQNKVKSKRNQTLVPHLGKLCWPGGLSNCLERSFRIVPAISYIEELLCVIKSESALTPVNL